MAVSALHSKHGEEMRILDMEGVSNLMDYCVLVTGTSAPHLKALFGEVQKELKSSGVHCFRCSGDHESGWVVLDYVDVVIHIFSKAAREFYAVEELWTAAEELPLPPM